MKTSGLTTLKETATVWSEEFGRMVPVTQVRSMVRRGRVLATRIGGRIYIDATERQRIVQEGKRTAGLFD